VPWHPDFGDAPRYGTTRCAASIRDVLSNADWKDRVAEGLPPEYADEIPMDLLGFISALPAGAGHPKGRGRDRRLAVPLRVVASWG
jgi:hypothetical protein